MIEAPGTHRAEVQRHAAMARAVIDVLRKAIADGSAIDLVLAGPTGAGPADAVGHGPGPAPRARVRVHDAEAVARLLLRPTPDGLADGYLRGDLDIEGDVLAAVDAGTALDLRRLSVADWRRLVRWGLALRRGARPGRGLQRVARLRGVRHSRARDTAAVRFHYDVGEAFFRLWLDRRLTYSCAYFPDGTTNATAPDLLDDAQEAKLDLIARKLRLEPGMRPLDIGCGWGSLTGFAAERYGVHAVGVTLSERQVDEANARAAAAGLGSSARAEVRDYRDLAPLGTFDAVASVGMFEHVGRGHLPGYFNAAYSALRPGGLFLNHGIATARALGIRGRAHDASTGRFIDRYVFPDGELVTVEEAVGVARASGFEVIDLQSLRPHYGLTLAAWVSRLEARWDAAVAAAGEEVARTWRLYMSAARGGFERGDIDVCQLLLAKPAEGGLPASLPIHPWW